MKLFNRLEHLTKEAEEKIEIYVPKELVDRFLPSCKYEVLVFHTRHEFNSTNDEKEMKKKIFAKFRDYSDAEKYTQTLAMKSFYYKVILRA